MAQRHCQRVCGIGWFEYATETEPKGHDPLHLALGGAAVAAQRHLYGGRCVLGNRQASLSDRKQRDARCPPDGGGRVQVPVDKNLFDRYLIETIFGHYLCQVAVNLQQARSNRVANTRANHAGCNCTDARAVALDNAITRGGQSRIDTQNEHMFWRIQNPVARIQNPDKCPTPIGALSSGVWIPVAGSLSHHFGEDLVGNVEIGENMLHVIEVFEGIDEPEDAGCSGTRNRHRGGRELRDVGLVDSRPGLLE